MRFFRKRLDECRDLVDENKLVQAADRLKAYLAEGLQEQSDVANLMHKVSVFDAKVHDAILDLENGAPSDARKSLEELTELLKEIRLYASLVAKEERRLE